MLDQKIGVLPVGRGVVARAAGIRGDIPERTIEKFLGHLVEGDGDRLVVALAVARQVVPLCWTDPSLLCSCWNHTWSTTLRLLS